MTPTLMGRMQSRLFLLLLIGIPWTLIASPFLPGTDGAPLKEVYKVTFRALAIVLVVGLVFWEFLYHLGQQFRFENDWPTLFGLVLGIPEAISTYWLLGVVADFRPPFITFIFHFAPLWVLVWLAAIGPVKIFLLRYRFRGGRFV